MCLKVDGGVKKCMPPNPGDGKCPGDHEKCTPKPPGFVDIHGMLRVEGNKVVDEAGVPLRLRGTSFFWSQWAGTFYNAEAVQWLVKDWNVTLVRAAMGIVPDGYLTNPEVERTKVETVVDAAISAGIYVIIDWHDHNATDHLEEAKSFFEDMAMKYGSFPNVLFEPFNEPERQPWASVIKPYHEALVPVIRRFTDNVIILGTPQWSQLVNEAALDPVAGTNLAYALHFYAASHKQSLRDEASAALANGAALFCTEWGPCTYDLKRPDFAEAQVWMDFLASHSISDAIWATGDQDGACSPLRSGASPAGGWPRDNLTFSGAWARASLRGDPAPSQ